MVAVALVAAFFSPLFSLFLSSAFCNTFPTGYLQDASSPRRQLREYHASARDPLLTFGHPISKCFPRPRRLTHSLPRPVVPSLRFPQFFIAMRNLRASSELSLSFLERSFDRESPCCSRSTVGSAPPKHTRNDGVKFRDSANCGVASSGLWPTPGLKHARTRAIDEAGGRASGRSNVELEGTARVAPLP